MNQEVLAERARDVAAMQFFKGMTHRQASYVGYWRWIAARVPGWEWTPRPTDDEEAPPSSEPSPAPVHYRRVS